MLPLTHHALSSEQLRRLLAGYRAGGMPAALAMFPEHSESQLKYDLVDAERNERKTARAKELREKQRREREAAKAGLRIEDCPTPDAIAASCARIKARNYVRMLGDDCDHARDTPEV